MAVYKVGDRFKIPSQWLAPGQVAYGKITKVLPMHVVVIREDNGKEQQFPAVTKGSVVANSIPYSNVKKGDRVSVKGAKKYDALSPDTVPGTVLFIHPDGKVAVQVGSGQMNVLPQDIINAYSNGIQRGSLVKIKTPYGKTITGEVVELTGGGIKVQDPVDKKQFYVVQESSVLDYTNSYENGRQKAKTHLNQKMAAVGVKVENIAIYVVEGEEFYGGTVFDAVAAWCKAHRKSKARVTAPGSVAGTYEMTAGGRAIKQ